MVVPGEPVIEVRHLHKRYGASVAVDDVSFDVTPGEVFALLGPNGAGKTTTVEILEGHRKRTGGEVRVLGVDPEKAGRRLRERVGIVLQSGGLDGELSVRDMVRLYAGFYPAPRDPAETIELVGLTDKARARVRTLSGGQQRRLDVALALIGDPDLLFLDEPTTGFDPTARRQAWDVVDGLRRLGKTVLLTSHYMDEVQYLADRVAVLDRGKLVAVSTPAALGGRDVAQAVVRFRLSDGVEAGELPDGPWLAPEWEGDGVLLRTDQPTEALALLTQWALERGEELVALTVSRPTLEDAYLEITDRTKATP